MNKIFNRTMSVLLSLAMVVPYIKASPVAAVNNTIVFGATSISVPKDTNIDLNSAFYRTLAADSSGDVAITNSGDITTNTVGTKQINYTGNGVNKNVPLIVNEAGEISVQRTIYTKEQIVRPKASGVVGKDTFQDRQHIGLYTPARSWLRVRLVNGVQFGNNLRISMTNNTASKSKDVTVRKSGAWTNVAADFDSIPFVITPNGNISPIIEVEYSGGAMTLPYYRAGDATSTETEFFSGMSNCKYGIIENKYTTIVVSDTTMQNLIPNTNLANGLIWELDTWTHATDAGVRQGHSAFIVSNNMTTNNEPATHLDVKAFPDNLWTRTPSAVVLKWNATTKTMSYSYNGVAGSYAVTDMNAVFGGNNARLMITVGTGGTASSVKYTFDSFAYDGETSNTDMTFFAMPNGAAITTIKGEGSSPDIEVPNIAGNTITMTTGRSQTSSIASAGKFDLTKSFTITGKLESNVQPDGFTMSLHNDRQGISYIGLASGGNGIYKNRARSTESQLATISSRDIANIDKHNQPFFSGTTDIRIPVNTAFDIKSPLFRIFADDYHDGELNKEIKILSNTVNANAIGEYLVKYSVTDGDGNTALLDVPVHVVAAGTNIKIQRTLYTLPSIDNFVESGLPRGNYHDSQTLGVYMPAGSTLTVKQLNEKFTRGLSVKLYNDDHNHTVNKYVPNGITTITNSNNVASVPVVKSVYESDERPVVEFEIKDNIKELIYYRYGDGFDAQEDFFAKWYKENDRFAVIENMYTTMIIPVIDRGKIMPRKESLTPAIEKAVIIEFDTYNLPDGTNQANGAHPRNTNNMNQHIAFVRSDGNTTVSKRIEHQQIRSMNYRDSYEVDVPTTVSWNAATKTLSYNFARLGGAITASFPISDADTLFGGTQAYLMLSSSKNNELANVFTFDSFQYEGEALNTNMNFFAAPNKGAGIVDRKVSLCNSTPEPGESAIRVGSISSANKLDLTKSFTLTGKLNIPGDDSNTAPYERRNGGLAITLHNDSNGTKYIGDGGYSFGVYRNNDPLKLPPKNRYGFSSIDELLEYYRDMCELLNRYAGVDVNSNNPLNNNVFTKYMVLAQEHGAGAAYYSNDHTAQNGSSMDAYLVKTHLNVHEFAHGYEDNVKHRGVFLIDSLNNIFSTYFSNTYLAENDTGWIGDYRTSLPDESVPATNKDGLRIFQYDMEFLRDEVESFDLDYGYREKLITLVSLFNTFQSEQGMASLYRMNRDIISKGIPMTFADILARAFDKDYYANVIPYLDANHLVVTDTARAQLYEKDGRIPYFLADLVRTPVDLTAENARLKTALEMPASTAEERNARNRAINAARNEIKPLLVSSETEARRIFKELGLDGSYSLVFSDDLAKYNLKGTAQVNIAIDDIDKLMGKTVTIKNGDEVLYSAAITGPVFDIPELPVGAYELEMPVPKSGIYDFSYDYITISTAGKTIKDYVYKNAGITELASDTWFDFGGFGNHSARLDYNAVTKKAIFEKYSMQPHSLLNGKYFGVKMLRGTTELLNKDFDATYEPAFEQEVQLEIGDRIEIYHKESGKLSVMSKMTSAIDPDLRLDSGGERTVSYIVTQYGIMKAEFAPQKQYDVYKAKFDRYVNNDVAGLGYEQLINKNIMFSVKTMVRKALGLLNETDRNAFVAANGVLLNGSSPKIIVAPKINLPSGSNIAKVIESFKASDIEDGNITLTASNLTQTINFNNPSATTNATFPVSYSVADSDGNVTTGTTEVVIFPNGKAPAAMPQISANLQASKVVVDGKELKLTVTAAVSDGGTLSYQWYKDDKAIGTDRNVYSVLEASMSDAGRYRVEVTNTKAADDIAVVSSEICTLSVKEAAQPPIINTNLTSSTNVVPGGRLHLTVSAASPNSGGLSYKWYKNDVLVGTNSNSYSVSSATATDAAIYHVVVTNTKALETAEAMSVKCTVTVSESNGIRIIKGISTAEDIVQGNSEVLSIQAESTSTGTLSYKWYKNNAVISGATSASYRVNSAGTYKVEITNSAGGTLDSANCIVSVIEKADVPNITTTIGDSLRVNKGGNLQLAVQARGNGSISYQWYKGSDLICIGKDNCEVDTSTVGLSEYSVVVTNLKQSTAETATKKFAVTVTGDPAVPSAPTITKDLTTAANIAKNGTLSLSVTATGNGTLSYQWYKGTTAVGTNSNSYAVNTATAGVSAYKVVVTNTLNGTSKTVTSVVCNVTVSDSANMPTITTQAPATKCILETKTATISIAATANGTLTYELYKNDVKVGNAQSTPTFTVSTAGSYKIKAINRVGTTVMEKLSDACVVAMVCKDDLNGDGKVDLQDTLMTLKVATTVITPNDKQSAALDLTGVNKGGITMTYIISVLSSLFK